MSWLRRIADRLSQRGAVLLILAVVDFVYAYALINIPPQTASSDLYQFVDALLPIPAWGALWGAVGVLCAVQAWTPHDRAAYGFATGLKVGWALLHLGAWIAGVLPRGYVPAAIWLLAAGLVMVISTVRKEPSR